VGEAGFFSKIGRRGGRGQLVDWRIFVFKVVENGCGCLTH
jgi:hypothetical protein